MGQNFLVEKRVGTAMLKTANITKKDTVLEVGPGLGTLTLELAREAKKVVAVEKDLALVEILKETLKDLPNVEVIHGDILSLTKLSFPQLNLVKDARHPRYKVVANLPYYLTSHFIRLFLELKDKPSRMTLMVQKEVAQRITAKPPEMSLLAVSVQFYAEAKLITSVKKTAFWPVPKIDSAILHIVVREKQPVQDSRQFFTVAKAGFAHPRKQLGNNLAAGLHMPKEEVAELLKEADIPPSLRAETLFLEDWARLAKSFPVENLT